VCTTVDAAEMFRLGVRTEVSAAIKASEFTIKHVHMLTHTAQAEHLVPA
jgi:hypothetical protein